MAPDIKYLKNHIHPTLEMRNAVMPMVLLPKSTAKLGRGQGQLVGNNLIPSSSTSPQNDRFCPEAILRETTGTQTDVIPRTTTGTQTEDCSPEPEPKLSNGETDLRIRL
ncbi:unnamed protein product [Caenorhabditis brenneri]